MTVDELIVELKKHPKKAEVFMAGWLPVDFIGGPWKDVGEMEGVVVLKSWRGLGPPERLEF